MEETKVVDVEQVQNPQKKCSTCKKGLNKYHWGILLFSVYILASAVKGTVVWVKEIINLF
jgi:hypothetical protein